MCARRLNLARLIIERSILLLLSASKCCLRQGGECLRALDARRSIVSQIRASISIIMAIVKCSVFTGCFDQRPGADVRLDRFGWHQRIDETADWPLSAAPWGASRFTGSGLNLPRDSLANGELVGASKSEVAASSSLQIMDYFLSTCNNSQSAHDAISRLQVSFRQRSVRVRLRPLDQPSRFCNTDCFWLDR